jgi:hypothetical protein
MTSIPTLQIRPAVAADEATLRRLAALDSQRPFAAPALIAELDGDPVAALSLDSGRAVADPFRSTAALVEILEIQARALHANDGRARSASPAPVAPRLRIAA